MNRLHFVNLDQLNEELHPPEIPLLFVESKHELKRLPFHKTRLVFLLTNYRHFAHEMEAKGRTILRISSDESLGEVLKKLALDHVLSAIRPAERETRVAFESLAHLGKLNVMDHSGWLTTAEDLHAAWNSQTWRMDAFYRHARSRLGILMEGGKPVGGKFSFDTENRQTWKGDPPEPKLPVFEPDEITLETAADVERDFAENPGTVRLDLIPQSAEDAEMWWTWAKEHALPIFGPFEDAMSTKARNLFHTRISAILNVHRLLPNRVVYDVQNLDIPIQSKEGFIRQVLGWREFVYQVHVATDGLRNIPASAGKEAPTGACPSALNAHRPLPAAYWNTPSGLNCLDTVVRHVWEDAYSHHITRLMIVGNIATLLSVEPREVTDWFWAAYIDSFDWVVEPNVLGMATFGTGQLFTTKPYVAGANYISKMSDYCQTCAFEPGKDCPVTRLYWSFLERNTATLEQNPRLRPVMMGLRKRSETQKNQDQRVFDWVSQTLENGGLLKTEDYPVVAS